MSTGPRNKKRGYELEVEVVKALEKAGVNAKRAWGSDGRAMGEKADVDVLATRYSFVGEEQTRIQVKRRKTLPAYLQIPESCDIVVFKQDRGPLLVLTTLDDWLDR